MSHSTASPIVYARRRDILWRATGDDVLLRAIDGTCTDITGAASAVWHALHQPAAISVLLEELGIADDDTRVGHVRAALELLTQSGLVEAVS